MVTGILLISTFAYHFTRAKEEKLFNYAYRQNTSISIQSILHSRERALDQNLEDNAAWDLMVKFVACPDSNWANSNLVTSRQTLNLDLIQVYNLDFEQVWALYSPDIHPGTNLKISQEKLEKIFHAGTKCHFFEYSNVGLMEIYGSVIVPSLDIKKETKPKGYLFFGKLWDKDLISEIENSSNSVIELNYFLKNNKNIQPVANDLNSHEIEVFLKDYNGKNLVRLDFLSKSFFQADTKWFYLFTLIPLAFAILALILFYGLIRQWISRPVRLIAQSLDHQDPDVLSQISADNPEFHRIARLVEDSFNDKKSLEIEISERKKAEERISKFAEELQEINSGKDKFFSILAHDLKSPFHYLLGYSDLLVNEYSTLSDEDRKKFISIIHSNSQRLYSLLENLLEWSRLQTGRVDFEMEVFDLAREVNQLCETLKAYATQKNISFETNIPEQELIKADRNMIRSSIHNLLTNAIKYTPEGGAVSITIKSLDSSVEISIKDNGIGMTPEEVAKLFRIDVSFSRPGTNKEPGTGLGLILTKEFIEKNGGHLFVESEPDKGSLFRLTLPLHKA